MSIYKISEKLAELGNAVIHEKENLSHLNNPKCRIAYQYSNQPKTSNSKTVYADTETVKEKLKAFIPYDFIITFYEPNTVNLTDDKMKTLMYHELRHVGFSEEGKYSIIPHEVEDFKDVIETFGIEWI